MGVESQSETVWRQANKYNVPRICFINKINQTGGDFYKSLRINSPNDYLGRHFQSIYQLVLNSLLGVVDLVTMKAYTYKDFTDHSLVVEDIPADMMDQVKKYRILLVENAVAEDEVTPRKIL